ncbi:methyltransferase [Paractinoplanes brasiliensis]|uniref:Methyltransferase family protein n=1 Tax=Paractinoplanes brasiliensis TaxID=52695 RepID=A0A4R6JMB9_9ACTN|nr:class I SAM-dependent methyltransferase [Actinoplanes brasiliensis]TDO37289.1 methyltransferase family protein [Actinoplanes brasiliensis]GID29397.1 SAM-dependent methyltransferase [Actinoplanes brasiliensis]
MTTTDTVSAPVGGDSQAADEALLQLGRELKDSGYHFTTVTPATHAHVNGRPGNETARTVRDVFGWSRPFTPGVLPVPILDLLRAADAVEPSGDLLRSRVRFSSYDDELYVHSAYPTDAPDSVFFGPDTYRMADAAAAHVTGLDHPPARVADVGTGSGAGAISVAKRAPGAEVFAVDINDTALRYARINAALAGADGVKPLRSNLLDDVDGPFDLIISNPPFMIDPAGRTYRDGGGEHGNELSLTIIDVAAQRLAPGGSLVLFSGCGIIDGHDPLREAAARRLEGTGLTWAYREVDPDVYDEELDGPAYARAERIAVVLLTATRPR